MKRPLSLLFFGLASLALRAQTPTVNWYYDLHDVSFGQTSAKDIDGDGKLELIFSTYWNDSNVYCLNSENGTLKWKHALKGPSGGCNDAGPLIFDPFGDGNYKVVVPGSCSDTTFCLDADSGYVQWKTVTGGGDSPPSTADLNNDGQLEVLQGTFDGHVVCLDGRTGAILWTVLVDANAAIESEPAIINNNGELDFVVATWDLVNADSNRIACYKGADHSLKWQYFVHNLLYHGPAAGDIHRTGHQEVSIGDYNGNLYDINAGNGSLVWKDSITGYYIGAPVTLADVDNDDSLNIIYADPYNVYAIKPGSTILWDHQTSSETSFRGTVVADVNGDDYPDVTFATNDGMIFSLNGLNGDVIQSINMNTVYGDTFEIDNAPIIADFNGDDTLDLFIVGGKTRYPNTAIDYGRAYSLKWGVGKGPAWTMFRHDNRRNACLCDSLGLPLTSVNNVNPLPPDDVKLYPDPSPGDFTLGFTITHAQAITISVMDMLGRKVMPDITRQCGQGNNLQRFSKKQTANLNNGIYLILLKSGELNRTLQLVITK